MKNREIVAAIIGLDELKKTQEEALKKEPSLQKYPIKVTHAISKNKKMLEEDHKTFIECVDELNKKYGVAFDQEGRIELTKLPEQEREEYSKELKELQDIEVNVDIHKINIEMFGTYEPSLKELDVLSFMIE